MPCPTVPLPKISVITPSYNQGDFLEATIRSVLLQGYSNLEYIIMDGGSKDQSVSIIRRYEPWVAHWQSAPDAGQTAAIQSGVARSTGDLIAWQNSDDFYYPSAFQSVAHAAGKHPEVDVFYGGVDYVDIEGRFAQTHPILEPTHENMLPLLCISNQALFFRRRLFREKGFSFNSRFVHFFDYEIYWRMLAAGILFHRVEGLKGAFRQHLEAKGFYQYERSEREAFEIHLAAWTFTTLDKQARQKLKRSLQADCLNDFGRERYFLLRQHVAEMVAACGWKFVSAEIFLKYLLSYLGSAPIRFGKGLLKFPVRFFNLLKKLNPFVVGGLGVKIILRSLYGQISRCRRKEAEPQMAAARWFSSIAKSYFGSSPITLAAGNLIQVDQEDSLNLLVHGESNPEVTEFLRRSLPSGQRVIEIGANFGYYTLQFCGLTGVIGQVFAFESNSARFALLQRNLQLNHYSRVICYECEVGEKNHEKKTVVLDDLPLIRFNPIHFIKLDLPQGDWSALQSMKRLLAENKAVQVMTEFRPATFQSMNLSPEQYFDFWRKLGFNFHRLPIGEKGRLEPISIESLRQIAVDEGESMTIVLKRSLTND